MTHTMHKQGVGFRSTTVLQDWMILRVGSRKEKYVRTFLAKEGIETNVPTRERVFNYASKKVKRQLPIIPGYVFVRATSGRQIAQTLAAPYAFELLRTDGKYDLVKDSDLLRVRKLAASKLVEWVQDEPADAVVPATGDLVQIARGPLAGTRGRFVDVKNKQTFRITLGMVATQLTICEVSALDIMPVPTGSGNQNS